MPIGSTMGGASVIYNNYVSKLLEDREACIDSILDELNIFKYLLNCCGSAQQQQTVVTIADRRQAKKAE